MTMHDDDCETVEECPHVCCSTAAYDYDDGLAKCIHSNNYNNCNNTDIENKGTVWEPWVRYSSHGFFIIKKSRTEEKYFFFNF